MTLTQKMETYLIGQGAREVHSPSRKYRKFIADPAGRCAVYWLGKAGALRIGATVGSRVSITHLVQGRF